ncbi:MAG: tetratricopeptide repeat protein [Myxococcota bacterium]
MRPVTRETRTYSRSALLDAAGKARAKGRHRDAIAEYQKILEYEPDNTDVLGKLAPLLIHVGEPKQAWHAFDACARGYLKKGFVDRAIAVYLMAAEYLPGLSMAWERAARLHLQRRRRAEAVKVLVEGCAVMRTPELQGEARRLLRCVLALEPLHYQARLELADSFLREGRHDDAIAVLDAIAPFHQGRDLQRIRGRMLRARWSTLNVWLWLRAFAFGR